MINTIVFDIGNVLARFAWKEYLLESGYNEEVIRRVSEATVGSSRWQEWDRGLESEAELIEQCCKQDPGVEKEIRKFFEDIFTMVKEFDYTKDLVRTLKENGYRIYLLSNYAKDHYENDAKKFSFLPYVDGFIISHMVHHVKPEPEIYKALITKYLINPKEAVFLDDITENLEGAKPFGFHTVLVQNYEQVIAELRKLKVNI